MNLRFYELYNLMQLFTEEDWMILQTEDFSPIVKLNLELKNQKFKQANNKIKHLKIFNFCFENRAILNTKEFDAIKFTIGITQKIYDLDVFDFNIHKKELKDIKTRLSEVRKKYIYPFFGLKEIIASSSEFDVTISSLIYFDKSKRTNNYNDVTGDLIKSITNSNYLCGHSSKKLFTYYDKKARHQSINNSVEVKKSLELSLEYFELFSHFEKLEKVLGLLNLTIGRTNTVATIDYKLKKPGKELLDKHLLLNIDYKLYQLLQNETTNKKQLPEKKLLEILKLIRLVDFKKLNNKLPYKTQLNVLKNFCIAKGIGTNKQYLNTAVEIIEILDSNNLLIQRGKINHVTFKNTVVLYLKANQNKKALSFYEKYKDLIQVDKDDLTEVIKNYTLGLIFLDKKEYQIAAQLFIVNSSIKNFVLELYHRQVLLIIAIQTFKKENNISLLKNNIKANENYLKNQKKRHPEIKNLEKLIVFAKNYNKKNKKNQPLNFLQTKWLKEK